jgi:hypothetical protein
MTLPIIIVAMAMVMMGNHTMDMNLSKGHTGCSAYIATGNISKWRKEGLVYECVPTLNYDSKLDVIHHIEQHGLNLTLHLVNNTLITIVLPNATGFIK